VNGEYVGKVSARDKYWWIPKEGKHKIEVRDTKRHSDFQTLEVRATW